MTIFNLIISDLMWNTFLSTHFNKRKKFVDQLICKTDLSYMTHSWDRIEYSLQLSRCWWKGKF